MNEQLLEPVKFYENTGKRLHENNAKEFYEELLKRSGVSEEENRATVKLYDAEQAMADQVHKKLKKYKALRVFLIILAVIGGILALCGVFCLLAANVMTGIVLAVIGVAMLIVCPIVIKKKLKPLINSTGEILEKHQQKAAELLQQAQAQVAPLLALFTEDDAVRLVEKTVPDFSFDPRFTRSNESFFVDKHDFCDMSTAETSTVNTLSGRLAGNPFLFCRRKIHEMGTYTYHGTLTISWTETTCDSKGNLQTRRRTQTLHASLTKPKPYYHQSTSLYFGSQAAPDLSFSREPQDTEELTEKQIEKKVRKGEKKLKKHSEKALEEGKNFQEMANTEFEVLFGALNRDHEVQFRLLFTPLAQRNMIELVTDKDAYGDDFYFEKRRRFNIIESEHSESWNLSTSPSNYYSHDVDVIRKKFVDFNNEFFKILFFDFAPLLSIPAYVEEPCASLEDIEDYDCNYTYYEHEVMANAIDRRHFVHERTATDAILKVGKATKHNKADVVAVTAYSYATEGRVDFVPVRGGDGRIHGVPVHWTEYIPLRKTTNMEIMPSQSNDRQNNTPISAFFHGMVARPLE
ncbi:MAG: hypothetical protein IJY39_06535 [Clostridia bacterium]|nr:hypothetical protein [Clostridia bacterium]